MASYTTLTGNGLEVRKFNRKPTTNITRHTWQGNTCRNCGIIRREEITDKRRTFYADRWGRIIGYRAPECNKS